MTRQQPCLQRACEELGLELVIPFTLILREGVQIDAQALMPQLGGPKGMIIVTHYNDLRGMDSELERLGYGFSVFGEPNPSEHFDLESYVEMFSDWGWGNLDGGKPNWMR